MGCVKVERDVDREDGIWVGRIGRRCGGRVGYIERIEDARRSAEKSKTPTAG